MYKLSLLFPFGVLVLLGKLIQATINLILYLGFVYSMFFHSWQQGLNLYVFCVLHAVLMVIVERRNQRNHIVIQAASKIIHE